MSSSIVNNPSPAVITQLLSKLTDADPDFRFMSLNDLNQILTNPKSDFLRTDFNTANRITEAVIKSLDDQNGEVQNLAVKWYNIYISALCLYWCSVVWSYANAIAETASVPWLPKSQPRSLRRFWTN